MAMLPGPDHPEDPEEPAEEVLDADFKPRRRRGLFSRRKKKKADKDKLVLWTISRDRVDYGCGVEYVARKSLFDKEDMPRDAVHLTGFKGHYVVVDMLPDYPEYADPDAEVDEDGNFVRPHNYFDAFGYFKFFADQRIKKGYDALGVLSGVKKPIDWKQIGIVLVVAVIVIAVAMQFVG